ncbi:type II toxin-antitoxin system Phd/YefM family antitoxin [Kutzneria sp. 744]|uniref:type II toxin-antitoxin system Phd/YefM family antitoxin n=1 Tax=Kutzneria sp. (strain 744) TaxID=345341 RepID=UPI0005BC678C|nr:type II toxin-antitoxin system Phd/YefM family antitoxin [Kutzneria sp. 744]
MPLGDARDHLSEVVNEVQRTHDRVTITRHGHPAAVILAPEDLEALEETIEILSTQGALLEIQAAEADIEAGDFITGEDLAAEFLGDR